MVWLWFNHVIKRDPQHILHIPKHAIHTLAVLCFAECCSLPRLVVIEVITFAAVGALGVMLTLTNEVIFQVLSCAQHTLTGMTVTFAPEIHGKHTFTSWSCLIVKMLSDYGADFRLAPSQWETALLCNDVFHWMGANLKSPLDYHDKDKTISWPFHRYHKNTKTWKDSLYIENMTMFLVATKHLYEWFSPSVCPFVTPFSLCTHHCIIMKLTNHRSDVNAKAQGQRSKVKVTEVKTQFSRFQTVAPI